MSLNTNELEGGWVKIRNIIAFPYQWQHPAKTEQWIYDSLLEKKIDSKFVEFICFPWATLIDFMSRGKVDKVNLLMNALKCLPRKKTLIRATACQHIDVKIIEDILIELNITDLFWSHKKKSVGSIGIIRLHPLALYPVAYYDGAPSFVPPSKREYLYSFIGAYDKSGYIDNSREIIFSMQHSPKSIIKRRRYWHFEKIVYNSQINELSMTLDEENEYRSNLNEYKNVLMNSIYSLCPTGAGVNSIRLWESMLYGCIPVIFSQDFDFPRLEIFPKVITLELSDSGFDYNALGEGVEQYSNIRPIDYLFNLFEFFEVSSIFKMLKYSH